MRRLCILLSTLLLIALPLLTGCGAVSRGSIEIDPSVANMRLGDRKVFSVTVTECSRTDVDWTATGGTVTDDGVYTAPNEPGTYYVTARCEADQGVSATATVFVEE
jgi:chitinase